MIDNFTDEYKKIMLETEIHTKQFGYKEILPEDVFLQVSAIHEGNMYDFFTSFGINHVIIQDVLTRPPFLDNTVTRNGTYTGISVRLKAVILLSVQIASQFGKAKAGIEDFLIALMTSKDEQWIYQILDFVGISPKDFESQLVDMNKLIASHTTGVKNTNGKKGKNGDMFAPIDDLMSMFENAFTNTANPFSANTTQGEKSESTTPSLDYFGTDLTAMARTKKIDPIIGRDIEIERLISVLNRKTKNNPCLVGDPGVGKTAVVEGLARRIALGDVPLAMRSKRVIMIDMSLIVAGTKYRGEFEGRIKQVIDEASKMENEVILFIDEIHTIIGAGSGEGGLDAANILKPAMARGKICLIGATTISEYQKYIEKDTALERRFQKIDVCEPSKEVTIQVLHGIRESFEEFHNLIIDDSAIADAVALSTRYITDRFLPDKAIDLIDEACSAKSMTYNIDDSEVVDLKSQIQDIQKDIDAMVISAQYNKAIDAKKKVDALSAQIQERKKHTIIPREKRMHISARDVQMVIHRISGVPLKNLEAEDRAKIQSLADRMSSIIIGQDDAIKSITSSLKRSRMGISSEHRPIGSFLFLGPTGVGKTELVKTLAREYFGDEKAMIKIDMSEYQDKSSASKLIGTTAGYVGYEEGGLLTEQVRRKPYSIVLFDEIEKGNFDIYNLLLQILEDGYITDGKGRQINFKNTIIIMTSNIGSEEFTQKATQIGFATSPTEEKKIISDYENIRTKVLAQLEDHFAPEFINRIDKTVVFLPLDTKVLGKIIRLQMDMLIQRLVPLGLKLTYDTKCISKILKDTYDPQYGARPVRRYIQDQIEDHIADAMLSHKKLSHISISAIKGEIKFVYT